MVGSHVPVHCGASVKQSTNTRLTWISAHGRAARDMNPKRQVLPPWDIVNGDAHDMTMKYLSKQGIVGIAAECLFSAAVVYCLLKPDQERHCSQ